MHPIPGTPVDLLDMPSGCVFNPRCPYKCEKCEKENPPTIENKDGGKGKCFIYERRYEDGK